jgi:hypothetical protein
VIAPISERTASAAERAFHFAHYNFVRIHPSLRVTPAMAAGVSDRLWFIEELIGIAIDGRAAA